MEHKLEIFKNDVFGEIRAKIINNEPYICLVDICKVLELDQASRVKTRLNQDGVTISKVIDKLGRQQEAIFINESNLYKVIFQSRKPEAEKFTEWVTSEVLPSIRKNGGYIQGQEELSDDELISRALLVAERKIAEKEQKISELSNTNKLQEAEIKEMKPKANYYDQILQNKSTMTITSIAKDYGMSAIEMNQLLHELYIQYKQSQQWFLYSKYQGQGYTHGKTTQFYHNDGTPGSKINTEWTQKGRLFIYNKLKEIGIVPLIERG